MSPPNMPVWNLALRFGLEVAALTGLAVAAWRLTTGSWRWIAVMAVPLVAAIAWTTFNVPNDPSRSGAAPIEVPGGLRLAIELAVLTAGCAGLLLSGSRVAGVAVGGLVLFHYATSLPRIEWMLGN